MDAPATCEAGSRHKECTVCGAILHTETLPPVSGHTESEWIVDAQATATQTGRRHKECTVCGVSLKTETLPMIAKVVIESVEAKAGRTVRVTMDIQNNPGIIGAILTLEFDSALKLVDVQTGSAWTSLSFTRPSALTSPCNLVWDGVLDADHSNGTLVVLTFELPANVSTNTVYSIRATYSSDNVIDANLESLELEIEDGSITVVNPVGDINDDGSVDVADVVTLRRYLAGGYNVEIDETAADMNNDGSITIADVVLLRRLLVG